MIRVFEYISQILNFLKKNSKEFFILFPYKSPSLCLRRIFLVFLVEGSRILSIKSVIDTQATSIIRENRINRQTDPVTVLSAWHMSTCKYGRTVHGFDTRIWPGWNVYLRESHRSQGVSGYNVVSRVIIQSKRDPVSRIGNASHYPLLCMYKSTCEDFNRRKPSRETPQCAG